MHGIRYSFNRVFNSQLSNYSAFFKTKLLCVKCNQNQPKLQLPSFAIFFFSKRYYLHVGVEVLVLSRGHPVLSCIGIKPSGKSRLLPGLSPPGARRRLSVHPEGAHARTVRFHGGTGYFQNAWQKNSSISNNVAYY
jgi:hypothetical protein